MEPVDLIGIGSPLVDLVIEVEPDFINAHAGGGIGGMVMVDSEVIDDLLAKAGQTPIRAAGGAAANTTAGCAALGISAAFLGSAGADEAAAFYSGELTAVGAIPRLIEHPFLPTGRVLCLVTPDGQRTMRTCLGAAAALDPLHISADRFADSKLVMLEGYSLFNHDLARAVVSAAKDAGCQVALDLASFEVVQANRAVLEELLSGQVDIVFANEDEASAWKAGDGIAAALDDLAGRCAVAVVKVGAEGAWVGVGRERHHVAAEPVERVVDTVGAGDCWAAGFLAGWLHQLPAVTCARLGSLAGAAVVQVTGARPPAAAWTRIRGHLEAWL